MEGTGIEVGAKIVDGASSREAQPDTERLSSIINAKAKTRNRMVFIRLTTQLVVMQSPWTAGANGLELQAERLIHELVQPFMDVKGSSMSLTGIAPVLSFYQAELASAKSI